MLARLGTVCGQGVAQSVGLLRALTVSAVVSQVVADVREGIVRPGQLQHGQAGAGAHRFRERRRQRGGGGGVLAVGGVELPVEGGLSPVSQVRDPGLLVGQGIDKLQGLGSFLGRKKGKEKKRSELSRGLAGILDAAFGSVLLPLGGDAVLGTGLSPEEGLWKLPANLPRSQAGPRSPSTLHRGSRTASTQLLQSQHSAHRVPTAPRAPRLLGRAEL